MGIIIELVTARCVDTVRLGDTGGRVYTVLWLVRPEHGTSVTQLIGSGP